MKTSLVPRHTVVCFSALVFCALFAGPATVRAQNGSEAAKDRLEIETKAMQEEAPAIRGILPPEEPRTRLPPYYRSHAAVSEEQREQIYELQRTYIPLLNYLKKRVELLQAELDEKIEAVLTEEQRKKVEQGRQSRRTSAARNSRTTTRPTATPDDAENTEATPAE